MMKQETTIKVYTASVGCLEDPQLFGKWLDCVPQVRREKAEGPKNPEVRKLSLGAGALLVHALRDYAADRESPGERPVASRDDPSGNALSSTDLRSLRIAENEHGKPYLPDWPELHFSLSHSGDRVMCAVSRSEVGCDVEEAGSDEADRRRIGYIARCLTERERALALADPAAFYKIWTLKESFLKLTGKGLTIPLASFEVTPDPVSIRQDILEGTVTARVYGPFDGYQYACAALEGRIPEEMTFVDLREALEEELEHESNIEGSDQAVPGKDQEGSGGHGGQ